MMNKAELVATIAEKLGCSKSGAATALEAVLETIEESLADGQDVTLAGFGVFKAVSKAARAGRNPGTGESIAIPATTIPKFVASKRLKEAVAKKG
nr:HU family DNA-binding protein [Ferrovum sp.]